MVAQCEKLCIEQSKGMGIQMEYRRDTKELVIRSVPQDTTNDKLEKSNTYVGT